jgi:hypothetical protein
MLLRSTLGRTRSACMDVCCKLSISATQMEICSSFFRCCLILHNQSWELSVGVAGTKFTNRFKSDGALARHPLKNPKCRPAHSNFGIVGKQNWNPTILACTSYRETRQLTEG